MQIKCLATQMTDDQRQALNASQILKPRYQIKVGQSYLVLGITFLMNSPVFGKCCLYTIRDDAGRCVPIPSVLGEITDGRVSRFWVAKPIGAFDLTLWPEEFYGEYFHDRVTDYETDAVQIFLAVVDRLSKEFRE
jgi:hypothetical protein